MAPKKRPAAAEVVKENKRYKSAIDEMADEFVCPISHELPVDPVTAEDGRVYERGAIEEWFSTPQLARGARVKSPVTNEMMGKRLFPAVQARNNIKSMVKSGALSGAKADAWKQRIAEEEEVTLERQVAEGGDTDAMYTLAIWYTNGAKGLAKDDDLSFTWNQRGALLEHSGCMGSLGLAYCGGYGTAVNTGRGILMLGQAAALGSAHACFLIGTGHQMGVWGLDEDHAETTRWFKKAQSAPNANMSETGFEEIRTWLCDHPAVP